MFQNGQTSLHTAAGQGYDQIVSLLLRNGANPTIRTDVFIISSFYCIILFICLIVIWISEK